MNADERGCFRLSYLLIQRLFLRVLLLNRLLCGAELSRLDPRLRGRNRSLSLLLGRGLSPIARWWDGGRSQLSNLSTVYLRDTDRKCAIRPGFGILLVRKDSRLCG